MWWMFFCFNSTMLYLPPTRGHSIRWADVVKGSLAEMLDVVKVFLFCFLIQHRSIYPHKGLFHQMGWCGERKFNRNVGCGESFSVLFLIRQHIIHPTRGHSIRWADEVKGSSAETTLYPLGLQSVQWFRNNMISQTTVLNISLSVFCWCRCESVKELSQIGVTSQYKTHRQLAKDCNPKPIHELFSVSGTGQDLLVPFCPTM